MFIFSLRVVSRGEKPTFKESLKSLFSLERDKDHKDKNGLFKLFDGGRDNLLNYKSKIAVKLSSFLKGNSEKKEILLNPLLKKTGL